MNLKYPELQEGIRVQYYDRDSKLRTERIHARTGNTITVINVLNQRTRIGIEKIYGYWNPKVKAKPENLIMIKE